ncbi:MAG: acyl-CoA dehydrogenase family protein [Eggerthellaceae bacterium]|nr:acyl-CoA dehydrogenase family protein [Eggerthellaceae bacterium]
MLHGLTEEQELIRNAAREFAENEIAPKVAWMEETNEFPVELMRRAGELGFTGIMFPEEYGGAGLGLTEFALVLEEVSRVSQTFAICLDASMTLCYLPILQYGTEEQKQKYLPRACAGEIVGAACAGEAVGNTGNCMNHITKAVKDGDEWVINGQKIFITNAPFTDTFVVYANANGASVPTLFIVDRDTPGLEIGNIEEKLGWHGSGTGTVNFTNVRIPADNLLGEIDAALDESISGVLESCIGIGAMCIGVASAVYSKTYEYVTTRETAGQKLIEHQAVAWDIARMAANIEQAVALVYQTTKFVDAGNTPVPGTPAGFLASTVKVQLPKMAQDACDVAIQLHGGHGYMNDMDIHRYWRDVRACSIGEGPTSNHLDFIALAASVMKLF